MTDTLTLEQRDAIQVAAARLRNDYDGVFGEQTIERVLHDSLMALTRRATYTSFVPLLAERFARERLDAAAKSSGLRLSDTPTVLFLCVHNAGRSQMAAGWLRHLAGDRVEVLSGGSNPEGQVNPTAIEAMAEMGVDIVDQFPKPWTEETLGAADVVVTMGCGDACPVIAGTRYLDWELADPASKGIEDVRPIRDDIRERVRGLLVDLGVDPVDA